MAEKGRDREKGDRKEVEEERVGGRGRGRNREGGGEREGGSGGGSEAQQIMRTITKESAQQVQAVKFLTHQSLMFADNTPDIVVNSLLEGGTAIRGVSHRLLLPLIACHCSDTEQPMLLFPKTSMGSLKSILIRAREPKTGGLVSRM